MFCSYFFYGYWDWRFCSLLAISTIVDYFIGILISKENRKPTRKLLLIISLSANLGILGFFKYFNFFVDSFSSLVEGYGYNLDYLHINIILPVGISFYTFQTLSYTIDVYKKQLTATNNFIDFALYVSFFPQLVAGPIERATNLIPQVSRVNGATKNQIYDGVVLIVYGLFKKVLIGDASGRYVDHIFSHMDRYSSWELLSATLLFSIQIYADFSGYSNIARGTAKLFGFELMKNFNQPYLSKNITEFWRRWHISLSGWLRDYLYIPLGGNRRGRYRTYINLMLTMLLGGLWHGASWNFVIWGGMHGFYLAVHKIIVSFYKTPFINVQKSKFINGINGFVSIIATYFLVNLTWFFFRVNNISSVSEYYKILSNWNWGNYPHRFLTIVLGFVGITFLFDLLEYKSRSHVFLGQLPNKYISYGVMFVMFMLVSFYMINSQPLPFIYFQF
ncbi:MBOAT family O-acyltransferase [Labilibacter marinus]|uniref:MBOAT family O-acyltransferase n=1 Tax=Labilibacter marinus TaxID=1477105 RepID=UPI001300D40C|nr:MBOAT family O-acyltransferase [Labilibacter marinus]